MADPWEELNKKFREQTEKEGTTYLPNPVISEKPIFCLICMEPSFGKLSKENFKDNVKNGMKNFMWSKEDFIIHYCAYKYLCGEKFEYHITDISKGAMPTKETQKEDKKTKEQRYEKWSHLLSKEIELLGNPRIIAIGKQIKTFLEKRGLVKDAKWVYHYSPNWPRKDVKKEYDKIKDKYLPAPSSSDLKEFLNELLEHTEYKFGKEKLKQKISKELTESQKKLLLYYKKEFSEIKNQNNH